MDRAKEEGSEARRFWWVVAQQCKERLAALPLELAQQKAQRRTGGEAKPSPRQAGLAEQAALLA